MVVYGRLIPINRVVVDQADIFAPDDFTRITGLTTADLTAKLFYNNAVQPWDFIESTTPAPGPHRGLCTPHSPGLCNRPSSVLLSRWLVACCGCSAYSQ